MKFIKKNIFLLLLLILSYFPIAPFFHSGFFPIHDDTQVQRVFEMKKALSDGMFPVRWVPDLGYNYGYPIFNFYAPFAYYLGATILSLGFTALIATKIMMALGVILAGISMYLLAKEFWGEPGGLIAGLLYLYAPYHAIDTYVRGDVAEFWGYAFIPLIFYGLWKSYETKQWKFVCIGSLAYAGVILSHNLTAMMITPFALVFTVILYIASYCHPDQAKRVEGSSHHKNHGVKRFLNSFVPRNDKNEKHHYPIAILFLGILLASFYWMPTLLEMGYTNVSSQIGGGADFHDHFVCLGQLWDSPWGFGGSTRGCLYDGLSFRIGKIHLLLSLISLSGLYIFWKKNKTKLALTIWMFISFFIACFLMLNLSQPIWDAIPHMAFFQYPWRFLLITSFTTSFLSGGIFYVIPKRRGDPLRSPTTTEAIATIVVSIAIIALNGKLFTPQTILPPTAKPYTDLTYIRWDTSKISDEYLMKGIHKPNNKNEIPEKKITENPNLTILSDTEKTQELTAQIKAKQKTDLTVHLDYFPAWHVFLDNQPTPFKYFKNGLLITIPKGEHNLVIRFIQTPIEKLANTLSVTGVLLLIVGIMTTRKEPKNGQKST